MPRISEAASEVDRSQESPIAAPAHLGQTATVFALLMAELGTPRDDSWIAPPTVGLLEYFSEATQPSPTTPASLGHTYTSGR